MAFGQTQAQNIVGKSEVLSYANGTYQRMLITTPELYDNKLKPHYEPPQNQQPTISNNSMIRWSFTDPIAIGDRDAVSGTGLYEVVGWGLNTERISLYGNANSTPLWEYTTDPNVNINYVAISDTGGVIAASSYKNVLMFNRPSSTPVFNFDLTTLTQTVNAGPIDITNDGRFIVVGLNAAVTGDSSLVAGFSKDSTHWTWMFKVGQTGAGGTGLQGVRICGNDSLAIVNTYGGFYVVRTYTGQLIFSGPINPLSSSSGTQMPQAISGDGSYIATINYYGYVRVYQRSGNTYNFLWQHQEPPGTFYNWMSSVDISHDAQYLAIGTLNFITSSSYDGKVKLFRTTNSTPLWTYTGFGDEVTNVAFSKNRNILAASSWGDLAHTNDDIKVWRISLGTNAPIFGTNTVGSFFWCGVSNDGSTVFASGKRVHARQFGNGGLAYNIFIDTNDTPVGIIGNNSSPNEYRLHQNYPNPFNPSTQIKYDIASDGNVKLTVFDMLGREVAVPVDKFQKSGKYSAVFNGENLTSGVYFYKLITNEFTETKKMILLK
jgi:hypothetical protein